MKISRNAEFQWEDLMEDMGGSLGDVHEEPVTQEKRNNGWIMSCGVGEATEGLENEL